MRLIPFLCMALLAGCVRIGGPLLTPVEWRVDNLESIGGLRPQVIGAPAVTVEKDLKALCFDGKSDGLLLPDNPIEGWSRFSIEILFKPDPDGPAEQRFLHLEDGRERRALIETRVMDGTWSLDTFLRATDTDKLTLLDRAQAQRAGRWHWSALVYDGATLSHYVDGQKQLEGRVNFPPMGPGRTTLGVRQNLVHWFKGCIARVRFTPMPLRASDLQRAN